MPATYTADDRVYVSSQHNQYRDKYGTVLQDNGDGTCLVRLDGEPKGSAGTLFDQTDLRGTDIPCPIDYDE